MNKKGYTLIELIVVIAIIAILLTIATISGRAWLDRSRVETQMKEMYADLLNARLSAMQRSRMYFVDFPTGPAAITQYIIYEDQISGNPLAEGSGAWEATDRLVAQRNIDLRYAMTIPGAGATGRITFDSRGLVTTGLVGTEANIRVITSFNAGYDCIEISATKTRMGVWNGANCLTQ
jgi:prepilin-type N-terminal cleavage/methylation domain-containing protein